MRAASYERRRVLALDAWAAPYLRRLRREGRLEGRADLVRHVPPADLAHALSGAEDDVRDRPSAPQLLEREGAFLSRTDLCELGLERRAVDAVFRQVPVIVLPGYSRPLVRREDFVALIDEHTYRGDRVRPC